MLGTPFIPETITVHLGTPDSDAANVTVPFPDYIKNVVAGEIYPTWPENAIRANIYAIVSFALNRIYTEWYRSRGYPFDITSSTQFDQTYSLGRETFSNTDTLVNELFNDYVRRQGSIEPLFAAFCNGTTVTCSGLSQWGTVELAEQGLIPYAILQSYYGEDIDIVMDAEVKTNTPSYPGRVLRQGEAGNDVQTLKIQLNRIAKNYPAIPVIANSDNIFGQDTEDAVRAFQEIFNLPVTGTVDQGTWYQIAYIYTSVKRLAELNSEGVKLEDISRQYSETLRLGMTGEQVQVLQYYLEVIGAYYEQVQPAAITGTFDAQTAAAVESFQQVFGLPRTGVVDRATWNAMYEAYAGIFESIPRDLERGVTLFSGINLKEGMTNEYVRLLQTYLTRISQSNPAVGAVSSTGYFGPVTRASVLAFQKAYGLPQTGVVNAATWDELSRIYSELEYGYDKRPFQFPGYTIK